MATGVSAWIRAKIRAKVTLGFLPAVSDSIGKSWAGKGSGRSCDGCDEPITNADVEYEIDDVPAGETVRFHRWCFAAWQQAPASQ